MKIPHLLRNNKTLAIALIMIAKELGRQLGTGPATPTAALCEQHGVARPHAYRVVKRVLERLTPLASAKPGRPQAPAPKPPDPAERELTIAVLRYRLEHPGAVVERDSKASYSAQFRRFVLGLFDEHEGPIDRFAAAVEIPVHTFKDWLARDRRGELPQPCSKPPLLLPRDASELCRRVAELYECWQGTTRELIGEAARRFQLAPKVVRRLLRILGAIPPRSPRSPRYRGSTEQLSPGAMLVTDGKTIDVALTGSLSRQHRVWQAIADQTTACDTAVVVGETEDAASVQQAFEASLFFLGGKAPAALLHDNKPSNSEASLRAVLRRAGTEMIPATPSRPENKAVVEGKFGLFEQQVGSIVLDDSNKHSLITSAVKEVVRTFVAVNNSVPRIELDGRSRQQVLRDFCPDPAQTARDQAFVQRLSASHQLPPPSPPPDSVRRSVINQIFRRLDIEALDPKGSLRRWLSRFDLAALRQAAAIVKTKLERGVLDRRYVHRYLAKVVINIQDECDLERTSDELLELCRFEGECWTVHEQTELEELARQTPTPRELAIHLSDRAAHGALPVQGAFWTKALLDHLRVHRDLLDTARTYLVRLHEAPVARRRDLLDRIAQLQQGLL